MGLPAEGASSPGELPAEEQSATEAERPQEPSGEGVREGTSSARG